MIAVSCAIGLVLGVVSYGLVAVVIAITALGLIFATKGFANDDESAPGLIWMLYTIFLSALLGAFWPALPVAFAWKRAERKPPSDAPKIDDEPPAVDNP